MGGDGYRSTFFTTSHPKKLSKQCIPLDLHTSSFFMHFTIIKYHIEMVVFSVLFFH